jgi:RimJ/RimL family protein N-acetyltransferase
MPFRIAWTDRKGRELADEMLAYHRRAREEWRVEHWSLQLVVFAGGKPLGSIDVRGEQFAVRRAFETGSWLGAEYQGRGFGTEMRTAALVLGFDGLGAGRAVSGAFEWNLASVRVSEKLGYRRVGEETHAPRGTPERELVMELTRDEWARREHVPVEIEGLAPCLPLFGL